MWGCEGRENRRWRIKVRATFLELKMKKSVRIMRGEISSSEKFYNWVSVLSLKLKFQQRRWFKNLKLNT